MNEISRFTDKRSNANKENQPQKMQKPELLPTMDPQVEKILFLQRTIGNQAIGRLINSGSLETKPRIQQASQIADLTINRDELPGPMSLPEQPPRTMASWAPSERGQIALSIALEEVGTREVPSDSNRGPCSTGATRGCVDAYTGGRAQYWCAHFVSWSFEQTGFSPFGHEMSVSRLRSWGKSTGWYIPIKSVRDGSFQPMAGDIFTMQRFEGTGAQRHLAGGHTGFVISYDPVSQSMETVEGNTGDAVKIRTRTLGELDGFIRVGT